MQADVLIVGQGLAGSLLAWKLMRQQYRVMIVDNGDENASQVAAGLVNPVTGQRLVKSRDVETLLPAAMACYRQLGEQFGQAFFVELPMLRILQNEKEREQALRRLEQADYQGFLESWQPTADGVTAPFGVVKQTHTGYLRTRLLLSSLRDFFIANDAYRQVRLDYSDIVLHPELRWQDVRTKQIVFCEGHNAVNNPWFGGLPFQPVKGEILGCETDEAIPEHILNYRHWLIPLDRQSFKTGATFDPQARDSLPTAGAEKTLLASLRTVCPVLQKIRIVEHKAGIRPATLDKQPFIGAYPFHANLHIFNGFGAKGSLAIPWHCRQFVEELRQQSLVNNGSHIRRYYDSHFPI